MRTRQRPARGGVIEDRCGPGDGVVARRAVRRGKWRSRTRVRRVIGLLPG